MITGRRDRGITTIEIGTNPEGRRHVRGTTMNATDATTGIIDARRRADRRKRTTMIGSAIGAMILVDHRRRETTRRDSS
jgi:hypothetical protein